jgi:hypothetical protein
MDIEKPPESMDARLRSIHSSSADTINSGGLEGPPWPRKNFAAAIAKAISAGIGVALYNPFVA